jgi:peptide-methionine (R)-S-oxide reductase
MAEATNSTNSTISTAGFDVTRLAPPAIEALAEELDPSERQVILLAGTERPFCGTLLDNKKEGTYVCRLCGLPLFRSSAKFESRTGWPSFFESYAKEHVEYVEDVSHGMTRVEIRCNRCTAHLGHVFPDGPPPTRRRYCLNSVSLAFVDAGERLPVKVATDERAQVRVG